MSCHNTVEMAWWEETLFQRSPSPSSSPPSPPSTRSPNHISTVRIAFTPAQHWSLRSGFDRFETLWGSWCVLPLQSTPPSPASSSPPSSSPVARLFFSGDTGYCGTYKEIGEIHGPFDLALIPVSLISLRGNLPLCNVVFITTTNIFNFNDHTCRSHSCIRTNVPRLERTVLAG